MTRRTDLLPALTQRDKKAQQERAEAERRPAEAEAKRKRQEEEAEKQRLLAEAQRTRQQQQQQQTEEDRKRAEILSGKVDSLLEAVVTAQRENAALQARVETERRQAAAESKREIHTALSEAVATAGSGTRNAWFFVLGGLIVVIAAVWYTTRAIRGSVCKVAGALEVVAADVKKTFPAMQNVEDAAQREREAQQERAEAEHRKVEILSGRVDSLLEVVTAAAEGDLTKEVEIEGDETLGELAAIIKELLEEVSKRNRADNRYQAAMADSLTRGWSQEPATFLVPQEEGGNRSEPGRRPPSWKGKWPNTTALSSAADTTG